MNDTKKYSGAMFRAMEVADDITPSVIALARASKVTAKQFAEAISNTDENSLYRNDVATELQKLFVARAVDEAKAKKEAK